MTDLLSLGAIGVIGFLSGALTLFFAFWKLKNDQILEEIASNIVIHLGNDPEMLETLYKIGGMIGQGAKTGIGLNIGNPVKGGKLRLNDILLNLAGSFIEKAISNPSPSPAPLTSPSLPVPNRVKDKFFNT